MSRALLARRRRAAPRAHAGDREGRRARAGVRAPAGRRAPRPQARQRLAHREGVAKIGDFGLAVALDRSRLTTHGLMVGTVAYMPPEQALGGEVTPQADLYSLGAMLYELVTGKPPFAGDSPTAIISQHINTPPVAPCWNSEHCPPDLEALILKLLAKVPADRPASAHRGADGAGAHRPERARRRAHSDSSANPLDRLARGVFVGREAELERLRSAFDSAFAGHGSVVMLVGEPGIGKTRAARGGRDLRPHARRAGAVGTRARGRGGTALLPVAAGGPGLPRPEPRRAAAQGVGTRTPSSCSASSRGCASSSRTCRSRPRPTPPRASSGSSTR